MCTKRPESRVQAGDGELRIARRIIKGLFGPVLARAFAVRYWDGSEERPSGKNVALTVVLRHPGALRRLLLPPSEIAAAEAYLRDEFDVEGDLEQLMGLVDLLTHTLQSPLRLARLVVLAAQLPALGAPRLNSRRVLPSGDAGRHLHTRASDAISVRSHYDVGNDFYRLWLDDRLVYSCAYFPTGEEDLNAAQEAKLEHICRKLRLRRGESLLDIGCGWGGLLLYAAEHYQVRATGITLSAEQADLARERIAAAGLADRATVEVRDYRDVARDACYDKVVSIGMLEHVGREKMREYFDAAYRVTRPGGTFLAHGIVDQSRAAARGVLVRAAGKLWGEGRFVEQYVFPDGELLAPWELGRAAEQAGWEIRDAENLREHYARTLRHWVRRLEAHHDEAAAIVGEATYRVWRLYMSGSANGFAKGDLGVIQYVLSKRAPGGASRLPLTRADLYR
jgi:cyclopropane-fatty-acyl-phospholipid synthase